jgi:hypothetical protein
MGQTELGLLDVCFRDFYSNKGTMCLLLENLLKWTLIPLNISVIVSLIEVVYPVFSVILKIKILARAHSIRSDGRGRRTYCGPKILSAIPNINFCFFLLLTFGK